MMSAGNFGGCEAQEARSKVGELLDKLSRWGLGGGGELGGWEREENKSGLLLNARPCQRHQMVNARLSPLITTKWCLFICRPLHQ